MRKNEKCITGARNSCYLLLMCSAEKKSDFPFEYGSTEVYGEFEWLRCCLGIYVFCVWQMKDTVLIHSCLEK